MAKQRILVCPVCGETQQETSICRVCNNALDSDGLLRAEGAIGPWWVRDTEFGSMPGMTYDHLAEMAKQGEIERHTIIRGPTTRQLWKVARRTPGIAHLLERCHSCGEHVSTSDRSCPSCNASFLSYPDRNNLGLDTALPSEGIINGLSSFLSDEEIMSADSTKMGMPEQSDASEESPSESFASPQFHSLQRRFAQKKRLVKVLSVLLLIALIGLAFAIILLLKS